MRRRTHDHHTAVHAANRWRSKTARPGPAGRREKSTPLMAHRLAPEVETELDNIWYCIAKESGNTEIADPADRFHHPPLLSACWPSLLRPPSRPGFAPRLEKLPRGRGNT